MLRNRYLIFLNVLSLSLKQAFIFAIFVYRAIMKPFMLGAPSCRFEPSCSEYSKQAFEKHPPFKALLLTFKRLLKCHPFGSYGYDPLPCSSVETPYEQQ